MPAPIRVETRIAAEAAMLDPAHAGLSLTEVARASGLSRQAVTAAYRRLGQAGHRFAPLKVNRFPVADPTPVPVPAVPSPDPETVAAAAQVRARADDALAARKREEAALAARIAEMPRVGLESPAPDYHGRSPADVAQDRALDLLAWAEEFREVRERHRRLAEAGGWSPEAIRRARGTCRTAPAGEWEGVDDAA